jgi:regulatory protein
VRTDAGDADPVARARAICLAQLGRAARTRGQLAETLRRKGIPDDVAEQVLDRFEAVDLIDDAEYADMFVRSRHRERGLSRRALGHELRRRGVEDDVVSDALESIDADQERVTARRLVDARLRTSRGQEPQARVRRLVGMLARKGYAPGMALSVVREALAEEGEHLDASLLDAMDQATREDEPSA